MSEPPVERRLLPREARLVREDVGLADPTREGRQNGPHLGRERERLRPSRLLLADGDAPPLEVDGAPPKFDHLADARGREKF